MFRKGQRLGHFEILESVAEGGMGCIFKAYDHNLKRFVAIKSILPEISRQEGFVQRFKSEAQALAKISHSNIVTVYAIHMVQGHPIMVMEYINGIPLLDVISKHTYSISDCIKIFSQIASGMDEVHKAEIIHRDIKPANILVEPSLKVKIVDFGIAKSSEFDGSRTETGVLVGSPRYFSPEVVKGGGPSQLSDIYSTGVVFYETLTGIPAFKSESALETIEKIKSEQLEIPLKYSRILPPSLVSLIGQMTEKDVNKRIGSMSKVLAVLNRVDNNKIPEIYRVQFLDKVSIENFEELSKTLNQEKFKLRDKSLILGVAKQIELHSTGGNKDSIKISNESLSKAVKKFKNLKNLAPRIEQSDASDNIADQSLSKIEGDVEGALLLKSEADINLEKGPRVSQAFLAAVGALISILLIGGGIYYYKFESGKSDQASIAEHLKHPISQFKYEVPDEVIKIPNSRSGAMPVYTLSHVAVFNRYTEFVKEIRAENTYKWGWTDGSEFVEHANWFFGSTENINSVWGNLKLSFEGPDLESFFPLRVGREMTMFRVEERLRKNVGKVVSKSKISCKIPKIEVVTVPAGRFESFKIVCTRNGHPFWDVWYSPVAKSGVKIIRYEWTKNNVMIPSESHLIKYKL